MPNRSPAIPDGPVPAIGYLRVSMKREEMISPEIQRSAIRRYARQNGRTVVDWIEDLDNTGRNFKRKVTKAIDYVRDGAAREILVYRYDRWGRNTVESLANVYVVEKQARGRLVSVTEPFDAETAIGKYTRTNAFALAEMQSGILGEGWSAAIASRVERQLPGTGGARFGYIRLGRVRREDDPQRFRRDPGTGEERYEIDPKTGPVLAELYRRYVAGDGGVKLGRFLAESGARSTRGGPIGTRAIMLILDSGFGAGMLRVHDPGCRCGETLNKCRNAAFATGSHPAVITEQEWDAYQERRRQMTRLAPRFHETRYPLAGLARCGECRRALVIAHEPERKGYGFRCPGKKQHLGCGGVWVLRGRLEDEVKAKVGEWAAHISVAAEAERERAGTRGRAAADTEALEREVDRVTRALAKSIRDQAFDEETPPLVWESVRADLRRQLSDSTAALDAARKAAEPGAAVDFQPLSAEIMEVWDTLPAGRLREMLRTVIREVRVTRAGLRVPAKVEVIPVWVPEDGEA